MERMDFDEIKKNIGEYFKKEGYEVQFGSKDEYKNVIPFRVMDKNKKVVVPEQKKWINEILNKADLESYLLLLKSRYEIVSDYK